jgi:hypothetical protein
MATGSPGTNGVWQYGEDDSEATFSALLNKAASTTDTAIGLDRGRLTTLEARPLAGLVPVVPSSVVVASGSASVNALGQVSFTGASTISLNGIFTSVYRNYLINIKAPVSSTGGNINYRFRAAGTDNSTSNYQFTGLYSGTINNGTANGTNQAFATLVSINSSWQNGTGQLFIQAPQTTEVTTAHYAAGGQAGQIYSLSGTSFLNVNASFDGISFIMSSGTFTGNLQVFGYND